MQTSSCVPCSSTPLTTGIPGPQGAAGPYPMTTTKADFLIPAVGTNVTILVNDTTPFLPDQNVVIGGNGTGAISFIIAQVFGPDTLVVTPAAIGGTATGGTMPSGSKVLSGVANFQGIINQTTQAFTVPVADAFTQVTLTITQPNNFGAGQNIFVYSPGIGVVNLQVSSAVGNQITCYNLGGSGSVASGTSISAGAIISTGTGLGGYSGSYATLKAAITIPAVGSTVTANFGPNPNQAYFAVGQNIYIGGASGGANFQITVISGTEQYTLKNLGFQGDLAVGVVIAAYTSIYAGTGNVTTFGQAPTASNGYAVYASGTPYVLTVTPADIGTTLTFNGLTLALAGTYLLFAKCQINTNAAKYTAITSIPVISLKLRRTNNTAADISNSAAAISWEPPVTSAITTTISQGVLPPVTYVASAGDNITIFASSTNLPTGSPAGDIDVPAAEIVAVRIS